MVKKVKSIGRRYSLEEIQRVVRPVQGLMMVLCVLALVFIFTRRAPVEPEVKRYELIQAFDQRDKAIAILINDIEGLKKKLNEKDPVSDNTPSK